MTISKFCVSLWWWWYFLQRPQQVGSKQLLLMLKMTNCMKTWEALSLILRIPQLIGVILLSWEHGEHDFWFLSHLLINIVLETKVEEQRRAKVKASVDCESLYALLHWWYQCSAVRIVLVVAFLASLIVFVFSIRAAYSRAIVALTHNIKTLVYLSNHRLTGHHLVEVPIQFPK